MAAIMYLLKFYESQEDYDNKNPFHKVEMFGSLEEAQKEAEKIKEEIGAFAYKIKEKNI